MWVQHLLPEPGLLFQLPEVLMQMYLKHKWNFATSNFLFTSFTLRNTNTSEKLHTLVYKLFLNLCTYVTERSCSHVHNKIKKSKPAYEILISHSMLSRIQVFYDVMLCYWVSSTQWQWGHFPLAGAYRGGGGLGCSNPPWNSEDIGGVLNHISKKNRSLDFLL